MSKITATFPDGYTDTYNGKRDVTAAWRIVELSTGDTLRSGHSLDRTKAQKTADSNLREMLSAYRIHLGWCRSMMDFRTLCVRSKDFAPRIKQALVEAGEMRFDENERNAKVQNQMFTKVKQLNERKTAEVAARYRIEIINL